MDLVNDLSSDVALAFFDGGSLRQKLDAQDAKSFIELLEAELSRISAKDRNTENKISLTADVSH